MTTAISVSGLSKAFGRTQALDGLDLTVNTGEVHGFLGPNGAGKSTTIRVLLGLLRADGGRVELLGGDPWRDAAELHRRLAYVPGDVTLWPTLSGGQITALPAPLPRGAARSSPPSAACAAGWTPSARPSCWSASSWTRARRAAPTPRATGRRS